MPLCGPCSPCRPRPPADEEILSILSGGGLPGGSGDCGAGPAGLRQQQLGAQPATMLLTTWGAAPPAANAQAAPGVLVSGGQEMLGGWANCSVQRAAPDRTQICSISCMGTPAAAAFGTAPPSPLRSTSTGPAGQRPFWAGAAASGNCQTAPACSARRAWLAGILGLQSSSHSSHQHQATARSSGPQPLHSLASAGAMNSGQLGLQVAAHQALQLWPHPRERSLHGARQQGVRPQRRWPRSRSSRQEQLAAPWATTQAGNRCGPRKLRGEPAVLRGRAAWLCTQQRHQQRSRQACSGQQPRHQPWRQPEHGAHRCQLRAAPRLRQVVQQIGRAHV